MSNSSDYFATHYKKSHKFTAYGSTFMPDCKCDPVFSYNEHAFHKKDDPIANTTNDMLRTIWDILKHQAKWLTEKMEPLSKVDALAKAISESLKGFIKDTIRNAISESLKDGGSHPQEDLEKQTQAIKDVVGSASKELGDQNSEMLNKLNGIKEEIERSLNDPNLDDKFSHTEKVIRDCIADVEIRISKLQKLGRDILEQVSDSSGKTDIEKLVLENNKILKELKQGNSGLSKEEKILEKLEEQQKVFDIMKSMGFCDKWCGWIQQCVATARMTVLVNGSLTQEFSMKRGLRQGDPLSPLLFDIVAEVLSRMLLKGVEKGLIKGVKVGDQHITHLQYTDDVILFSQDGVEGLKNLKRILRCFALVTGLKVNFHKSSIIGINQSARAVESMAAELYCKADKLPIKYLGLPLGANPRLYKSWEGVVRQVRRRLAAWKGKMLSLGGRLTLVKSVVNSIPLFSMSIYKMPKKVIREIEMLTKRFVWKGDIDSSCIHKVQWRKVGIRKEVGGAGLGILSLKNVAMLTKWCWKVFKDPSSFWASIFRSTYSPKWSSSGLVFVNNNISVVWKDIVSSINASNEVGSCLRKLMNWKLGSGNRILFWEELWWRDVSLKDKFPRLFSISSQKSNRISPVGCWNDGVWNWNFRWRRSLFVWEEISLNELIAWLDGAKLSVDEEDSFIWDKGELDFSVKQCYGAIEEASSLDLVSDIPNVWNHFGTSKSKALLWLACQNRILSKGRLARFNLLSLEDMGCLSCEGLELDANHIFVHCDFAQKCWSTVLKRWGVVWVYPESLVSLVGQWESVFWSRSKDKRMIWDSIMLSVIWSIWMERNGRVFKQKQKSFIDISFNGLLRGLEWARVNGVNGICSPSDLLPVGNWNNLVG